MLQLIETEKRLYPHLTQPTISPSEVSTALSSCQRLICPLSTSFLYYILTCLALPYLPLSISSPHYTLCQVGKIGGLVSEYSTKTTSSTGLLSPARTGRLPPLALLLIYVPYNNIPSYSPPHALVGDPPHANHYISTL